MSAILFWITNHSSALIVIATVLGVVVAGIYSFLTWRLANAAIAQAQAALTQAEASRAQATAATDAARAAADQAVIARQIFEAAHRPYVELMLSDSTRFDHAQAYEIGVQLQNHGPVPATLVDWDVTIRSSSGRLETVENVLPQDVGRCLFPGRELTLRAARGAGYVTGTVGAQLSVTVRYGGTPATRYKSRIVVEDRGDEGFVCLLDEME